MKKNKIKILVSAAGRRVALIQAFRESAEKLGCPLEIIATDCSPDWSPACQIADRYYQTPRCTHPQFIASVLDIVKKEQIDLLIPTIDTELIPYANEQDAFLKEGCRIHISNKEAVLIFRDKYQTMQTLAAAGISIPETFLLKDFTIKDKSASFSPLILKPLDGSCSQGLLPILNENDLPKLSTVNPNKYLVQTLLNGDEYTVNCYFNKGKLITAVPHYRKLVRAGEVCFAETAHPPNINDIAEKIGQVFQIEGAICFQGFYHENQFSVIEINGRFGGGYPIAHHAGATMTQWLLEEKLGISPSYSNQWRAGVKMLRYDAAVFTG